MLPCEFHREEILKKVAKSAITLIVGETGCGKSTIVPSILFDDYGDENMPIICLQPRRIACCTIANRVAELRGGQIGKEVGYEISQRYVCSSDTKIFFVTSGLFLQRVLVNPREILSKFKAVVIDEVHERSCENEMTIAALSSLFLDKKFPLAHFPRIILMTATANVDRFKSYYRSLFTCKDNQEYAQRPNCETLFDYLAIDHLAMDPNVIPYQVGVNYLEDLEKTLIDKKGNVYSERMDQNMEFERVLTVNDVNSRLRRVHGEFYPLSEQSNTPAENVQNYINLSNKFYQTFIINLQKGSHVPSIEIPACLHKLAHYLILHHIYLDDNDGSSSILVFLPDYYSIERQWLLLKPFVENPPANVCNFHVHVLHGHLEGETDVIEIERLHDISHKSNEKRIDIFLATSVAESSITVPNLKVVVDFCVEKQVLWTWQDEKTEFDEMPIMRCVHSIDLCSKAQLTQRKGRTGRTSDGIVYRLIPVKLLHLLKSYPVSQLQKSLLLEQSLPIIDSNSKSVNMGIFDKCMDVPEIGIRMKALEVLENMGAVVKESKGNFSSTTMGNILCSLPVPVYTGLLVYHFTCTLNVYDFSLRASEKGFLRSGALVAALLQLPYVIRQSPFSQDMNETAMKKFQAKMMKAVPVSKFNKDHLAMCTLAQLHAVDYWNSTHMEMVRDLLKDSYSSKYFWAICPDQSGDSFVQLFETNHAKHLKCQTLNDVNVDFYDHVWIPVSSLFSIRILFKEWLIRKNLYDVLSLADDIITRLIMRPCAAVNSNSVAKKISVAQKSQFSIVDGFYSDLEITTLYLLISDFGRSTKQISANSAVGLKILTGTEMKNSLIQSSGQVCLFFSSTSGCKKGENCLFSHEVSTSKSKTGIPLCRNWESGSCAFGERCRYYHPIEENVEFKQIFSNPNDNFSGLKSPENGLFLMDKSELKYFCTELKSDSKIFMEKFSTMQELTVFNDFNFGFSRSLLAMRSTRENKGLKFNLIFESKLAEEICSQSNEAMDNYNVLCLNDCSFVFGRKFGDQDQSLCRKKINMMAWNFPHLAACDQVGDVGITEDVLNCQEILHRCLSGLSEMLSDNGYLIISWSKSQIHRCKLVSIARHYHLYPLTWSVKFEPEAYKNLRTPVGIIGQDEHLSFIFIKSN